MQSCMASFCHSITYTGCTNSSAYAEHVYAVFSFLPEGNKHFTTITAFTRKLSSRRVHSYGYEFLRSGRSRCQKARQDVAKRLLCCLYLNTAFIFSSCVIPLFLRCCFALTHTARASRKQLLQPGEKSLSRKGNFIFVGKKDVQLTLKLSTAIGQSAVLTQALPPARLCLSSVFPICCIYPDHHVSFSPVGFLVRRHEPKPAVQI